jgi:hypothetical protein
MLSLASTHGQELKVRENSLKVPCFYLNEMFSVYTLPMGSNFYHTNLPCSIFRALGIRLSHFNAWRKAESS